MNNIVLSCFDKTTNMVQPWLQAGHICYCVDIQHPPGKTQKGNLITVGVDILKWCLDFENIRIAFFFPPCTNIAASGARWFKKKGLRGLIQALELFDVSIRIAEHFGAPYMIENPVSTISTYWHKPDFIFQPWQYGDMYSKKTCLWTGNGFKMPKPLFQNRPKGVDERIWKMSASIDRADKRSKTPLGFAKAVFEENNK